MRRWAAWATDPADGTWAHFPDPVLTKHWTKSAAEASAHRWNNDGQYNGGTVKYVVRDLRPGWDVVPTADKLGGRDVWGPDDPNHHRTFRTERGATAHAAKMQEINDRRTPGHVTYVVRPQPGAYTVPASVRRTILFRRLCTVPCWAFGAWFAIHGDWIGAVVEGAGMSFVLAVGEFTYWRYRNGLRRAARDRDDPRTGAGQVAVTNPSAAGARITTPAGTSFANAIAQQAAAMQVATQQLAAAMNVLGMSRIEGGDVKALPEREDDTPILAFKTALLRWTVGERCGLTLRSRFTGDEYVDMAVARCRRYPRTHEHVMEDGTSCETVHHVAPVLECTCGFYAVRDRDRLISGGWHTDQVMLDVELFGRVIVFKHGYRAQQQRLLRIGLPGCWYCDARPSHVIGKAPLPWDGESEASLIPICEKHIVLAGDPANLRFTIDELAAHFGGGVSHELAIPSIGRTSYGGGS